jgi:hypothetical protein
MEVRVYVTWYIPVMPITAFYGPLYRNFNKMIPTLVPTKYLQNIPCMSCFHN